MHHRVIEEAERLPHGMSPVGVIATEFDPETDIITVRTGGLWSPKQVDQHFDEMDRLIDAVRKKQCRVRVFVDRRNTQQQSLATSERLLAGTERVYGPDDRVAVIVDSSLAKTQSRASIDPQTHRIFISETAAMMWLRAYD